MILSLPPEIRGVIAEKFPYVFRHMWYVDSAIRPIARVNVMWYYDCRVDHRTTSTWLELPWTTSRHSFHDEPAKIIVGEFVKSSKVWHHETRSWYYRGERHRDGAPAVEITRHRRDESDLHSAIRVFERGRRVRKLIKWMPTAKIWMNHGRVHRLDGPAIESLGYKFYVIDGKYLRGVNPDGYTM